MKHAKMTCMTCIEHVNVIQAWQNILTLLTSWLATYRRKTQIEHYRKAMQSNLSSTCHTSKYNSLCFALSPPAATLIEVLSWFVASQHLPRWQAKQFSQKCGETLMLSILILATEGGLLEIKPSCNPIISIPGQGIDIESTYMSWACWLENAWSDCKMCDKPAIPTWMSEKFLPVCLNLCFFLQFSVASLRIGSKS